MNRRLFARKLAAGVSLLGFPSSLLAHSVTTPTGLLSRAGSFQNATGWIQNGSLGALQQVSLSHVYSPERTSPATLKALLDQDLATLSELLGLEKPLTCAGLPELSPSEFGTYWAPLDQGGVRISWQGLARINQPVSSPVSRLSLLGSRGLVQTSPGGKGYTLIELSTLPARQVRSAAPPGHCIQETS
ncbi:hypothetical protein [Fibrella aquatica]|uniref:hypothetical protein n=1 Tax=Fibrella aquatica TaxID=3242487 RepID=UPI00351F8B11